MNSRQPWVTQDPDTKKKKDLGTAKGGAREQKSGLHSKGFRAQEEF